MKILLLVSAGLLLSTTSKNCSRVKSGSKTYKAKLETKALCMNYTLRITEGNIDTSLVNASWTDENTGKTFTNAFGLGNPCQFPKELNEGDEFYFMIDTTKHEPCAVCMAYYPTPPRKLSIKVVPK